MSEGPYRAGAEVRPTATAALFRGRGDRRGFEPLHPGALPGPDRAPDGTWSVGELKLPLWTGGRCDRLLVDLSVVGLSDAVRMFPILAALQRLGRPGGEIVVVVQQGPLGEWMSRALAPLMVVPVGAPLEADAVIPPLHMLVAIGWKTWPRAPLTALAARALGLPLASLAGPCLRINQLASDRSLAALTEAGWDGSQPVVGLQSPSRRVGEPLDQVLQGEKIPASIAACAPALRDSGLFPVRFGGETPTDDGVLDLGGAPIDMLVGMIHRCDLIVTGDSGPMQLGAAIGTPTLAIFGPSDAMIQVGGASVRVWTPELLSCPRLPCGVGSILGGPVAADAHTRIPLPCPPEGGCLTRTQPALIAAVTAGAMRAIPR